MSNQPHPVSSSEFDNRDTVGPTGLEHTAMHVRLGTRGCLFFVVGSDGGDGVSFGVGKQALLPKGPRSAQLPPVKRGQGASLACARVEINLVERYTF